MEKIPADVEKANRPPEWLRRVADRAVDMVFARVEPLLRRSVHEADLTALMEPPPLTPELPPAPSAPVGTRLSEPSEAFLQQHRIPPDVVLRVRQDIRDLPQDAQILWLTEWRKAREFSSEYPEMPENYDVNTAWKAVNADFQKTELGWQRRMAAILDPTVSKVGDKLVVMLPGPGGTFGERHTVDTQEEADRLVEQWRK